MPRRRGQGPKGELLIMRTTTRRIRGALIVVALVAGMLGVGATPAQAAIFNVTTTAATYDGVCDDHCTLWDAVYVANGLPGEHTVFVPGGEYTATTGPLTIWSDLTLQAVGGQVTLDAKKTGRVLKVNKEGDATLKGFLITNGKTTDGGAGILNEGTLTLIDTVVNASTSSGCGGGLLNYGTARSLRKPGRRQQGRQWWRHLQQHLRDVDSHRHRRRVQPVDGRLQRSGRWGRDLEQGPSRHRQVEGGRQHGAGRSPGRRRRHLQRRHPDGLRHPGRSEPGQWRRRGHLQRRRSDDHRLENRRQHVPARAAASITMAGRCTCGEAPCRATLRTSGVASPIKPPSMSRTARSPATPPGSITEEVSPTSEMRRPASANSTITGNTAGGDGGGIQQTSNYQLTITQLHHRSQRGQR